MVAISCRRAYHVCSTAVATTTGAAATGRGHRLLLPLLTTHCYAVALHAVRRYSRASDGGRHDDSITVAADDERVTVPPPPITRDALPVWNGTTTSTDRGISTVRTLLYRVLRITPKSLHTIHPEPSVIVRALLRNDPNHASMPPGTQCYGNARKAPQAPQGKGQ